MNVCRIFLIAACVTALSSSVLTTGYVVAQDPFSETIDPIERIKLFESLDQPEASSSQSDVRRSRASVAELRQARAAYRANQRVARLEHNLWVGYEPLRPKWNAVPMMTSRYSSRRVIYVPVYVRSR